MELAALAAAAAAADPAPAPLPPPRPLHTRLTPEQRWTIIVLRKRGETVKDIAQYVPCSRHTVRRVWHRYRLHGDPHSGARAGRPRCTDEATDVNMVVEARVTRFTSPRQVKRKLELDCSRMTVERRLSEAGMGGYVARHKRQYTEAERAKRLSFARGYAPWTPEQWTKVLFSDEKCFFGKGFCGRVWVRREQGTALSPEHVVHQMAHPVKVNVWGCFAASGPGYAYIFEETMDAALMRHVLNTHLLESAKLHFRVDPPEQWYLLHDNDKKFKSRVVTEWLHNNGVTVIDFPPYSPDLNPIENLWNDLQRRVETQQAETIEALKDIIQAEWAKCDAELLRKLVHSMPKRCRAAIEADGWHTKY